ncbi:MAG: hypothetical protein ACRYG7_26270 [Janthinobacterium lividum]
MPALVGLLARLGIGDCRAALASTNGTNDKGNQEEFAALLIRYARKNNRFLIPNF